MKDLTIHVTQIYIQYSLPRSAFPALFPLKSLDLVLSVAHAHGRQWAFHANNILGKNCARPGTTKSKHYYPGTEPP